VTVDADSAGPTRVWSRSASKTTGSSSYEHGCYGCFRPSGVSTLAGAGVISGRPTTGRPLRVVGLLLGTMVALRVWGTSDPKDQIPPDLPTLRSRPLLCHLGLHTRWARSPNGASMLAWLGTLMLLAWSTLLPRSAIRGQRTG